MLFRSEFRERFLNKKSEKRYVDYDVAQTNKLKINFEEEKPFKPK